MGTRPRCLRCRGRAGRVGSATDEQEGRGSRLWRHPWLHRPRDPGLRHRSGRRPARHGDDGAEGPRRAGLVAAPAVAPAQSVVSWISPPKRRLPRSSMKPHQRLISRAPAPRAGSNRFQHSEHRRRITCRERRGPRLSARIPGDRSEWISSKIAAKARLMSPFALRILKGTEELMQARMLQGGGCSCVCDGRVRLPAFGDRRG